MERDLASEELWASSLARSRRRRELAARRSPLAPGRNATVVAAVAAGAAQGSVLATPLAGAASMSLSDGSRGNLVQALQSRVGVGGDGVYGARTAAAVERFQRRHGLTVDGVAGPATLRALRLGGARAHRTGAGGVRALQRALGVAADGVFGPATETAVRDYQASHGLGADGVVGPATRSALGIGSGPTLRRGRARHGSGGPPRAVRAAIAAANRIAALPYVYGGGHGSFSSAGYDCSGSVSYVLHGAGVLKTPEDSGELESYGVPGRGRWITIYAAGGHAYMTIGGRRFDTSARSATGSRWTSQTRAADGYVVRHPAGL